MKLSIVELGTVAPGTTERDGLADALETARHAEERGFHRVWFAEHHLSRSGASHHPELLIAAAAMRTSRIRLGSGVKQLLPVSWSDTGVYSDMRFAGQVLRQGADGRVTGGRIVVLKDITRSNPRPMRDRVITCSSVRCVVRHQSAAQREKGAG